MNVTLLSHTPESDRLCAAAAFTSWKQKTTVQLFSELNETEAMDFLRMVIGFGHESVMEHANFTFAVSGISRACSHQLVRHRIASFTQQSQRYIKFKNEEIEFVTPPSISSNPIFKENYELIMRQLARMYELLISKGIPPEDARFVLPNASATNIVVTMNARELNHFFRLRCCERTQWELRNVADEMLKQALKIAPVLFGRAGPGCVIGRCPEGGMTCGKIEKIRKKYKSMGA